MGEKINGKVKIMWRPCSDIMIIEKYEDVSRITLPDNVKPDTGDTFIVKDIGPGFIDSGIRVKPEVQIGDRVAIVGKIINVPTKSNNGRTMNILLARAGDVICYERGEEIGEGEEAAEKSLIEKGA